MLVRNRVSLLDVAAEVLVTNPSASLAQVAEAAGIGRTTLHSQYATRDDLIRAVGLRALDLWEKAVADIGGTGPHERLRALAASMIPIGPQLAFLWRTPAFDHDEQIMDRQRAVEVRVLALLESARDGGLLAADAPGWWLLATFHALVYVGAESVDCGNLAPREAPDRVMAMFLHGIGKR